MKKTMKRLIAVLLMLAICCTSLPLSVFAAGDETEQSGKGESAEPHGYFELSDGYASVKISKSNGGYYVSTVEGDVITKVDNDKDIVYSDALYDTSFTSFRVVREGKTQDYIFGRDYSHLGIETSDVNVYKSADNAVVAEWTVDGILIKQTVALMGTDTYQHGMAYIAYSATNVKGAPIESIKARVLIDTAMGEKDYAYYMLAQNDGSYTAIEEEKTVSGSDYYNYFFAYDDKTSPTVTAYTLNANIEGESIVPEKVTFAHWYNLASNVFDYTPSKENPLKFTELYGSIDHLTQDSAAAMYYDMSSLAEGESSTVALYYGVYSNYNAGDAEIALNFTSSGAMFFNDDETAYKDINGSLPGNFSATFKIQNIAEDDISKLAVAIYPEEEIYSYDGDTLVTNHSATSPYYKEITELKAGEANDVRFDFKIDPTYATGYRKIKIVVYNTSAQSELGDDNAILEDAFYVLCPGAQNASVGFTGMTPESVFIKGMRYAYITGTNFGLIRDKSQYRIILRPQNGGADVVLDQDKVVINTELNTATLVLDMELDPATYDVIIDWNDVSIEDMTSDALKLIVTDVPKDGDPGYVSSGVYGIAAIIREGRHYELVSYESEADYNENKPEEKDIMLVMRGNFNFLSSKEQGVFKAEAITLMEGDTIIINETLEVREGRVTINKVFGDDGKQKEITVDIDGKVYTTKANTKVWDGVLAITALEEGKLYTLPVYSETGERTILEGEEGGEKLTLLWPGAASAAQTLVGLLINLNYGEFSLMKQNDKYARVVSFGASLNPSILVPSGKLGTDRLYSNLEKKQLEMGVSAYSAEQLRANDTKYRKDQASWRAKQAGTLNFYMDDILFGSGGFIGFNTQLEVGIPSYVEGMPYVTGTLYLKVINDYWEFGVDGKADMMLFEMEASLHLKSYNGIPVPDSFYFFIGGVKPGLPIDPFGVFWVRGAGAGIGEIYETFFGSQLLPPLTLMVSGEFAIFSVLEARADISISAQGLSGYLNKVGVAGITIIDRIGGSIYWYPNFNLSFEIRIDIFDAIVGEGKVVVKESKDGVYFGGFARASISIPDKIWLIGGTNIGSASVGIDTNKVWGSVKIIGIGVGVVYYWGGDVDVSVGKNLNVPEPFMLHSTPVYTDAATGKTLYMAITNDINPLKAPSVTSSADKLSHDIHLDAKNNENILMAISYSADNAYMAEDIKNSIKLTFGEEAYALEWFNAACDADSEENEGANAIYRYNEESKIATVSVSFTDATKYGQTMTLTSSASTEVNLYTIIKNVTFDSLEISSDLKTAVLSGSGLEKVSKVDVYATDSNGATYPLAQGVELGDDVTDTANIAISIPAYLPSGNYKVEAVGTVLDENGSAVECPIVETDMTYVNPNQPKTPLLANINLGGNYTLTLDTKAEGDFDGFVTNIYEVTEDGYAATVFSDVVFEIPEGKKSSDAQTFVLGGRVASTDEKSEVTSYIGLEAGKKYFVSVQSYKLMDDGSKLMSVPLTSSEIMMVMPTKTELTFKIDNSVSLQAGNTKVNVDTVNTDTFTVKIGGAENIKNATYTLNSGEAVAWDGKDIALSGLADGGYTLKVEGVNSTMDSFSAVYAFAVDTESPSMLISSPMGGGFFSGNSVTVAGITEAGAKVEVIVGDGLPVSAVADGSGAFSIAVAVDETYAYQDILVRAYDAVGNASMPFGCTLTNELLGATDLKAVILSQGKEISTIVCSGEEQPLTMAFKTGNKYITLNKGSTAESRIEWSVQAIEKNASITKDGVLLGDSGAKGLVLVKLDSKSAAVEMDSIDLTQIDITPVIPEEGYTYDGNAKTPEIVLDTDVELVEGEDYTVTYINNVSAGVASAVITAVSDGKCVGTVVVNFDIKARDLSGAELSVDFSSEEPTIKVTLDELDLNRETDYTVDITYNLEKTRAIVTIEGSGNYSGFISQEFDISSSSKSADEGFDHLIWIIPVATVGGLLLIIIILRLINKAKRKKKADAKDVQRDTEEDSNEGEEVAQDAQEVSDESVESDEPSNSSENDTSNQDSDKTDSENELS